MINSLPMAIALPSTAGSLESYIQAVNRYPLLTEEEEMRLAREYRDHEDGKELSRRLKAAGFRFVGPTTVYSSMEACGIVNGHRAGCWVRDAVEAERAAL